jgi:hypothetical protein
MSFGPPSPSSASQDSAVRWKELQSSPPSASLQDYPIPEKLIPLWGTPEYDQFSKTERTRLYLYFCQFNAEMFILLESLLLIGFRRLSREISEPQGVQLLNTVVRDEYRHARAFRKFLREESALDWPRTQIVLNRGKWLKKIMVGIVLRAPMAMALPGAKIEAYSVHYGKYLEDRYKEEQGVSPSAIQWLKLNHLHMLDEVFHVPHEFELFKLCFGQRSRALTLFGTLFFVLFLQWALISSTWKMLGITLERPTFKRKLVLTAKIGRWVVRRFPPYDATRRQIRRQFETQKPPFGWMFRFIYW